MTFTLEMAWLEAVMLAGVRMVAFLVIAPPFNHGAVPARIKVMLALGLAVALGPKATAQYASLDTGAFIGALVLEIVFGALLGFGVYLVTAALQAAGSLIDLFGGFSMAQAFDPGSLVNGAQFTRLYQMTAIVLMFTSDAYQLVIGGLARSFDAAPVGGVNLDVPAEALIGATTQMFLAAIQIAGPLLAVLFLADVGLGLLNRVAPALNAFAMGFPLKIFLTITLSATMFVALPRIVASLTDDAVELLTGMGG